MPRRKHLVLRSSSEGAGGWPDSSDPDQDDYELDFEEEFEIDGESVGVADGLFDDLLGGSGTPAVPDLVDPTAGPAEDGIELRPDQRMAIEVASNGIETKSFYEILLLPRSADERAIKRAYYRLSKEYHPDKFYRKELGDYKEKLESIFNKVNEAYRVLSDPDAREDYDLLVFGEDGKDAASPTEATTTVNFIPDAERKKAAAKGAKETLRSKAGGRSVRKGPPPKFLQDFQKQLATKIARARRHMKAGEKAVAAGNHAEAASNFQMAMTLDPRNLRAKGQFKRAQAAHRNARAEDFYVKSQEALLSEDMKRSAELMQQAVDCKPTKGKYYNEFGKLVSTHTLQQRVGLELLRKAVEFEPRNVEYTLDLARAYEELGMPSNAIRAFERVLHLDSKKSEAAKALKRLK
jgi:curved DNA-binding protein CbpA